MVFVILKLKKKLMPEELLVKRSMQKRGLAIANGAIIVATEGYINGC